MGSSVTHELCQVNQAAENADARRAHAMRFAAAAIGRPLEPNDLSEASLQEIFFEISRTEEIEQSDRDSRGNWDWPYSRAHREGRLYEPTLDLLLDECRKSLQVRHPDWSPSPIWPNGKPFAICLTHDVDEVCCGSVWRGVWRQCRAALRHEPTWSQKARSAIRPVARLPFKMNPRSERWHFDDWLDLESRHGTQSTFLFAAAGAEAGPCDPMYRHDDLIPSRDGSVRLRTVMQTLARSGWDVGLHGTYDSATQSGLLTRQRQRLEEAIGSPITSTRQHWLRYDAAITPRLQAEAGILADSTQGFDRSIGFRAATSFPYWCWDHADGKPLPVLEIPMHVMDGSLFEDNSLQYREDAAISHVGELMRRVCKVGGCLTLNWHAHARRDAKRWTVYRVLLEEAASHNAWFCSMSQLNQWWRKRET